MNNKKTEGNKSTPLIAFERNELKKTIMALHLILIDASHMKPQLVVVAWHTQFYIPH
jgi:hypothetical protein